MYTKTEAAYKILKEQGKPLQLSVILCIALSKKMIKTNGKTPLSTLGADLINERKRRIKSGTDQRFVRTAPGTWGLAEWGFTHVETIPKKGSKKNTSKK